MAPSYAIHALQVRGDLPEKLSELTGLPASIETKGRRMALRTVQFISTAAAIFLAGFASAQEVSNRVAADTDWAVFKEPDPEKPVACWAVTAPKETVNTRDGRAVSVRRGDILLFVTFRPEQNVVAEVSFTGGYPFAGGSPATMEIAGSTFELFTEGEYAWPATPADDAKIVTAMKRGATASITARSSRGTQTKDTFSLLGATAMIEDAEKRCSN